MVSRTFAVVSLIIGAASCAFYGRPANAQHLIFAPCNLDSFIPEGDQLVEISRHFAAGTPLGTLVNPEKPKSAEAQFRVPAGPLEKALGEFLCMAGGSLTYPTRAMRKRGSPVVEGQLPSREALRRLLAGTGVSIAHESTEGFILNLQSTMPFNIPAGKLDRSIEIYRQQGGTPAIFWPGTSHRTTAVGGVLPPREALARLLAGTGLTFLEDQNGDFRIRRESDVRVPGGRCVVDPSPPFTCQEQ